MTTTVRSPGGLNKTRVGQGKARRMEFLASVIAGRTKEEACERVGWSMSAYRQNRSKWADWRAEVDLALDRQVAALNPETANGYRWDPSAGFAQFRRVFLHRSSAWFHLRMIDAMERAEPGSVTLILAPPGCLAGDTRIGINRGGKGFSISIAELEAMQHGARRGGRIWRSDIRTRVQRAADGVIRLADLADVWASGVKMTFTLTTDSGRAIRATGEHPFATPSGFVYLADLGVGDEVCINAGQGRGGPAPRKRYASTYTRFHPHQRAAKDGMRYWTHRLVAEATLNGMDFDEYVRILRTDAERVRGLQFLDRAMHVHHANEDHTDNGPGNLVVLAPAEHRREHDYTSNVLAQISTERIVSIEPYGDEMTYDLAVADDPHNFIANGFVVHNSGKTSLWEDRYIEQIATDPDINILIGSERREHAGKIASFVRANLEHEAPGMGMLRERFGPFAPPRGGGASLSGQQWGTYAFSVAKRNRTLGREPTVQAIGMGSSIIGARTNFLGIDDPQSRKTLNKTETLVETFRQDWLSRPLGTQPEPGKTVIVMNRVGEGDFAEYLVEETDLVDHVVKIKAWNDGDGDTPGGWYWPEMYDDERMRLTKRKVGQDAWDRNFMQLGIGTRSQVFDDAIIAKGLNNLRSINHPPPRPPDGGPASVVLSLDPGFGVTAVHAGAVEPYKFRSLDFRVYRDVDAYGDFAAILENSLRQFTVPGVSVVRWVQIETKAFQRGLIRDEPMLKLRDLYGFELQPVETGGEKNDEDIGVQALRRMLLEGALDFPNADEASQERYAVLYRQMRRWRPFMRGNKLEQDVLVTLWFGSMLWRRYKRTLGSNGSNWNFRGLTH